MVGMRYEIPDVTEAERCLFREGTRGKGAVILEGVEVDAVGQPSGRIFGLDGWIRSRVPKTPLDLAAIGRELTRFGVTGVTDATPTNELDEIRLLTEAQARGDLPQGIMITGGIDLPDLGDLLDLGDFRQHNNAGISLGPVKLVIPDHRLPDLDQLVASFRQVRARKRALAVHCVTRVALILALAAWNEVGARPGDRIEHGSVIPIELATTIAELGLTVGTQPGFIVDRGDQYLREVDAYDLPDLYRCATLRAAGVPIAGSTDAPFGPADPWQAIATAIDRRTASGMVIGPQEKLSAREALGLFLTPPTDPGGAERTVRRGAVADLCLLTSPLSDVLLEPSAQHVRNVLRAGNFLL